jgi:hypothetical protein
MVGWSDLVLSSVQRRCSMSAGKGDTPRPVNAELYGQHYEDIFRKDKPQTTETNESENKSDNGQGN